MTSFIKVKVIEIDGGDIEFNEFPYYFDNKSDARVFMYDVIKDDDVPAKWTRDQVDELLRSGNVVIKTEYSTRIYVLKEEQTEKVKQPKPRVAKPKAEKEKTDKK